jgi:hypothetical protein
MGPFLLRLELRGHVEDVSDGNCPHALQIETLDCIVLPTFILGTALCTVQVRSVCCCDLGVITGSRDKTIKVWGEQPDHNFALQSTLVS